MLSAPLALAELGYSVFPIRAGEKKPLTKNGLLDATTDAEQIERWQSQWPNANWAIRTDGLLVLDIDGAENEWFKSLGERAIDLAIAPISLTPSGGRHFLFRAPNDSYRCTQSDIAPKVDTRAAGGYIVVAPSVVAGKPYKWSDELDIGPGDLPLPPQWLLEALTKKPTPTWQAEAAGKIGEGLRNRVLFRMGCAMRRPGFGEPKILAALNAANIARCDPPLDPQEVARIAQSAAKYAPDEAASAAIDGRTKHARYHAMSEFTPKPVRWLWRPRFALGKLSILAGEPGLGKSFLTMYLAACVTRGRPWTDTPDEENEKGSVVLLSAEDDPEDTIRPRLDLADADSSLVTLLEAIELGDGNERLFNLEKDLPELEQVITNRPDCRLVIVDPITAYCGKTDTHKGSDVRGLLSPLAKLAAKHGVAVVAVSHLSKSKNGEARKAMHLVTGSHAFIAQARAGWLVQEDHDDKKRRLLLPLKNNLAENVGGLAFRIVDGAVKWEQGAVTITADEAINEPQKNKPQQLERAAEWLGAFLDGPQPKADVEEAAEAELITPATLRRAKDKLGVVSRKGGFADGWLWYLPSQLPAEGAQEGAQTSLGVGI
jgi:hypothetical protein